MKRILNIDRMKFFLFQLISKRILFLSCLFLLSSSVFAQGIDVTSCPVLVKRANGNGGAAKAAGIFPGYGQNNPVAANVVGTSYQTVPYAPASKTGDLTLAWTSTGAPIVNVPVVTRVWTIPKGGTTPVLASIAFGPPAPPALASGTTYNILYNFYVQNIPPTGTLILEFSNPQTSQPVFLCSYDLGSGSSTTTTVSCAPTISVQPANVSICGTATANFSITASGVASYQWQVATDTTATWSNVTNGANYSGATTNSLTVSNATTLSGKYYRVVLTGSGTCGTTTSKAVLLLARPLPTATFTNAAAVCGLSSKTLGVTLTGTAPWTITYSNGSTTTTVNNITSSPYYFTVSPAAQTTYTLTSVADAYCSNSSLTGATATTLYPAPTVSSVSATAVCLGSTGFNLAYTATNGNTYSITAGTRAMPGFTAVTNAALGAGSSSITIPGTGYSAGTYDFNLTVTNSTSGCVSAVVPFTLVVNPVPAVSASASAYTVCSGTSVLLNAAGASTYSWSSSPAGFSSTSASPSVTPTTTTTYTVTGTSAGCSATASTTVTVSAAPAVSIASSSTTICSGASVYLTASGANTYSWSGPSGYTATGSSITVAPTATGTYTVTGTNSAGCTATASQQITVTSAPSVSVSPASATICAGSAGTSLTASGATTYLWSPAAGLSATTGATVTANPSSTTTYTVTGTSAGCTGSTTVTVTVTNSSPVTLAPPKQLVYCSGDFSGSQTISFSITSSSAQVYTWQYSLDSISWTTVTATNGQNATRSETTGTSIATSTLTVKTPQNDLNKYYRVSLVVGGCTYYYYTTLKNIATATGVDQKFVEGNQSICSGTTPAALTFYGYGSTGSGGGTAYVYTWEQSANGTTWATATGTASSGTIGIYDVLSLNPGSLSATTYYRLKFTGGVCSTANYSNVVTVTVNAAITGNTLTAPTDCSTSTLITGTTISGATYSWESSTNNTDFTTVAGAASKDYTAPVPAVTTYYRRIAVNGCSSTSTSVALYPVITATGISNGQTICAGGSLTNLSVSPAGGPTGESFTYLWQSSTDNVTFNSASGTNNTATYTPSSATGTTYYRVVVSKGSCSVTSNVSAIVVSAVPAVTVSPSSAAVCSGQAVTLTASGAANYSWSPATDLSAATGTTVIATPTANRTYTVTGTNEAGCTATATATLTYTASPATPSLSQSSKTICSTATPFDLSTLITSGAGTYEWRTVPDASATYSTSNTTSVSGTYYVYASSNGCYSASAASVALTVTDVSKPTVSKTALTLCDPATADLGTLQPAAISGTVYEWHTVASNPHAGTKVANASAVGSGTYYLYAYSADGNCYGPASDAVTITITSLITPTVSSTTQTACAPQTINLSSLNSTAGAYTFNWYNTNNPVAANLVAIPEQVAQSGTYYLYATNNGCTGPASSGVVVTVNSKPSATVSSPEPVCGGAGVSITATTDASGPTYTWEVSTNGGVTWSAVADGGVYSGATTAILSVSNTTGLGGYYYRVSVTKNGCTGTSDASILLSQDAPAITQQPAATATGINYNASFSVTVSGNYSSDYQWQVSTDGGANYNNITNGAQYSGADAATLVVLNADLTFNTYKYRCIVTNSCNTLTATAAVLTVTGCTPPTPTFTTSPSGTICVNADATYTTQPSQTNYIWTIDGTVGTDYTIVSGGTTTSNTVVLKWLKPGNKTVTVNYTNGEGCSGSTAANATNTVSGAVVTDGPDSSQLIATGNTVTLSPSTLNASSFQWTRNGTDIALATNESYTLSPVEQTNGGIYKLRMSNGACNSNSPDYEIIPSIVLYSKPTGNLNLPQNWGVNEDGTGSTPVDFTRDEHTFVLRNRSNGNNISNLTVAGTLDVKDGIYTIDGGTKFTAGRIVRTGSIGVLSTSPGSRLEITGITTGDVSDLYFSNTGNTLKDLILGNNSSEVYVHNRLNIASNGTVTVNSGKLHSDGNITFKSTAANASAIVAPVANGASIEGNVIVERFIPAKRAYRLLTSPVTTSTSIRANWMEGATPCLTTGYPYAVGTAQNPLAGFGTHITGPGANANGFDQNQTGNPSIFKFNSATQAWETIPNTTGTMTAGETYRMIIRGDRSISLNTNTPTPTNTILRTTGTLATGDVTVTGLSSVAGNYSLVGNPYQAPVDFSQVVKSNLEDYLYIWDANITGDSGRGAFVAVANIGGTWTNSVGTSLATRFLQPGQSVFVRTQTNGAASLIFKETNKAGTTEQKPVFRPSGAFPLLRMELYDSTEYTKGQTSKDGLLVAFNTQYSNQVTTADVPKLTNLDETFSVNREGQFLAIEKRLPVTVGDTIPLNITQYRGTKYALKIDASALSAASMKATLIDNWLKTESPVQLGTASTIFFTVDGNTQGAAAANRFMLVLRSTDVTAVTETDDSKNLQVYPNPVTDLTINFSMQNQQAGKYNLRIINMWGQVIEEQQFNYGGGTFVKKLEFKTKPTAGVYILQVKGKGVQMKRKINIY